MRLVEKTLSQVSIRTNLTTHRSFCASTVHSVNHLVHHVIKGTMEVVISEVFKPCFLNTVACQPHLQDEDKEVPKVFGYPGLANIAVESVEIVELVDGHE